MRQWSYTLYTYTEEKLLDVTPKNLPFPTQSELTAREITTSKSKFLVYPVCPVSYTGWEEFYLYDKI